MALTQTKKSEVIEKFQRTATDTGSAEVQVAILSERINGLTKHFDVNVKDHSSRRGLLKMVGTRRKLLKYLRCHDMDKYKKLIGDLGIRK